MKHVEEEDKFQSNIFHIWLKHFEEKSTGQVQKVTDADLLSLHNIGFHVC